MVAPPVRLKEAETGGGAGLVRGKFPALRGTFPALWGKFPALGGAAFTELRGNFPTLWRKFPPQLTGAAFK